MPRPGTTIPKAPVAKLMASAKLRVSDEAASALVRHLMRRARAIGERAAKLAKHAKRKTVSDEDIDLASR